jgi:hypothetical protein
MKRIPLTRGQYALVDDADYDYLMQWKWHILVGSSTYYAKRCSAIRMHRVILDAPKDQHVDHRDGNGLNNQRYNLRLCTRAQNAQNRKLRRDSKSGFKGVRWVPGRNKWRADIKVKGKSIYLGYFTCVVKAAKAYDEAAIKYFGEFAWLNFKE